MPQNCSFRQSELNEKCGVGVKEKPDLPCEQQYQDQKVQELISEKAVPSSAEILGKRHKRLFSL